MGKRHQVLMKCGCVVAVVLVAGLLPTALRAQVEPVGLQDKSIMQLAAEQGDSEQGWYPGTANLLFAAALRFGVFQGFTWDDGDEWTFIGPPYDPPPNFYDLEVQHWGYGPMDGIFLLAAPAWSWDSDPKSPVLIRREFNPVTPPTVEWERADSGLAREDRIVRVTSLASFYFSGHTPPQPVIAWADSGLYSGYPGGSYWQPVEHAPAIVRDMDVTPHWFGNDIWGAGHLPRGGINDTAAVFRSRDKGLSWETFPLPGYARCDAVAVCNQHPDTAWVAADWSVLRSYDGGKQWEEVLEARGRVVAIETDPLDPAVVYVAGSDDFELYRSSDFGDSWKRIEAGWGKHPRYINCMTVALMDTLPMSRLPRFGLFMGTSKGVWVYDMLFSPMDVGDTPVPERPELSVYPNPVRDVLSVELSLREHRDVSIEVIDMLGRVVKTVDYGERTAGKHVFSIVVRDVRAGAYIVRSSCGAAQLVVVD
ncbi:MAG: hypothetical protein C0600_01525 [Ignavibacteria bacterium]|nr:MAG: hypothetical protein C0600_01525 [Ignavibacteria bacterium]